MTNFSIRDAVQSDLSGGGARVPKAILSGAFDPVRSTPSVSVVDEMNITRDEAWRLFCEWTQSDSLRKHVLGVEAEMVAYAREFGEDEELWAATGILHDLDYERYPDPETGHPRIALKE